MHETGGQEVAIADGLVERCQREVRVVGRAHRPADDAAREELEEHREICPPVAGRDVRDVARPSVIRRGRLKVARQQVRGDRVRVVGVRGAPKTALLTRYDAVLAHQARDAFLADTNAALAKRTVHARAAYLRWRISTHSRTNAGSRSRRSITWRRVTNG